MRDAASARLARTKADHLLDAGVIDAEERKLIYGRSAVVLGLRPEARSWSFALGQTGREQALAPLPH